MVVKYGYEEIHHNLTAVHMGNPSDFSGPDPLSAEHPDIPYNDPVVEHGPGPDQSSHEGRRPGDPDASLRRLLRLMYLRNEEE